jgi:hypothetical protein
MLQKHRRFLPWNALSYRHLSDVFAVLQNILSHQFITEFLRMRTVHDARSNMNFKPSVANCKPSVFNYLTFPIRAELKVVFLNLLFLNITYCMVSEAREDYRKILNYRAIRNTNKIVTIARLISSVTSIEFYLIFANTYWPFSNPRYNDSDWKTHDQ